MLIPIPTDVKTTEFTNSIIWLDENGIMFSVPKKSVSEQFTIPELKQETDKLRALLNNKKVCVIAESANRSVTPPKAERDFIANELNGIVKAMAIISTSPLSRMVSNLFFSFKPPKYPYRMCSSLKEARNWIEQYL